MRWAAGQLAAVAEGALGEEAGAAARAEALAPLGGVARSWSAAEGRAAWHAWSTDADPPAAAAAALQPAPPLLFYCCGEAFSSHQGWMEGALETADAVLHMLLRDLDLDADAIQTERRS